MYPWDLPPSFRKAVFCKGEFTSLINRISVLTIPVIPLIILVSETHIGVIE